jgi:L-fuculose-phosphate aldolase
MRASPSQRAAVIAVSHLLAERGWVANHDGNVTVRVASDRFLATPTATHKRLVSDKNLIEVDGTGRRITGTARPFSEFNLHMAVYQARADVGAVVHAHPPHATAIACSAHNPIARVFLPEAVVSIGAIVPMVPLRAPGADAKAALAALVGDVDAALLQNHGVMAWGCDVEQAYLRMELVEHMARIAIAAQPLGGVQPLPDAIVGPLLRKRASAGLGQAADRATEIPIVAARPGFGAGGDVNELVRVVREELANALDT